MKILVASEGSIQCTIIPNSEVPSAVMTAVAKHYNLSKLLEGVYFASAKVGRNIYFTWNCTTITLGIAYVLVKSKNNYPSEILIEEHPKEKL